MKEVFPADEATLLIQIPLKPVQAWLLSVLHFVASALVLRFLPAVKKLFKSKQRD